jgi:DAACS family dicarboxylate/amino acid:cation (Na+ or H+) symporter
MKLWVKILIALVLGAIFGSIIGERAIILKPLGDLFMRLISMIIVLLVFSSMTIGITNIHDPRKLGRVGLKTLFLFVATTTVSIAIGLVIAYLFNLGSGVLIDSAFALPSVAADVKEHAPTFSGIIQEIVPSNPISALANGDNMLQIIFFAIALGIAINFAGDRGKPLKDVIESLSDVMYRLTSIIMEYSPVGVFATIAVVTGTMGWEALFHLIKFLGAYYLACGFQLIIVICGVLWFFARLRVIPFFRGMSDAIMVAFSTSSSSAALPVSMHCVQKNLGCSKNITNFILPLGSTINMNGAGMYQGMVAIFMANAYGIEITWPIIITILIMGNVSAIGAAGVPSSGILMLSVVLSPIGIPAEAAQAMFIGIDRIREMVSTILNILGDAVCAVYVAKQEGELDERQYNHEDLVEMDYAGSEEF